MQLGSFCFTVAGTCGDILVIRLFLFLAYAFLLLGNLLGNPQWPNLMGSGFFIDSLVWSLLNLYVHSTSLIALYMDERPVKFASEEHEALWRLLYRTGGLSARIFQSIVAPYATIITVANGELIDTKNYFHIVYKGSVRLHVVNDDGTPLHEKTLRSGETSDWACLGAKMTNEIKCYSRGTTLYAISREDMKKIVDHSLAKVVWQALLINSLTMALESERRQHAGAAESDDTGIDPLFRPLEPWEEPELVRAGSGGSLRRPFLHLWNSIRESFSVGRPPAGLRQTQLPAPPSEASDPNRANQLFSKAGITGPMEPILETSSKL
jgi:hypothetical protein